MITHSLSTALKTALMAATVLATPMLQAQTGPADAAALRQGYQLAQQAFKSGRFPDAYGRFMLLARQGHAPSALAALRLCEQGPDLHGHDLDCTPEQAARWAQQAGVVPHTVVARDYGVQVPAQVSAQAPAQAMAQSSAQSKGQSAVDVALRSR